MDIQGTTRYYLLDVPTSADNKTPLMLIFALHGHNMNNISVVGMYNFTSRSGGKAITVYPQGDGDAPGTTSKWGSGITSNWTSNDANYAYIQALKADLENRFCIDTSREFFTGFSMGGMFTNSIACAHNSWFRGYAARRRHGAWHLRGQERQARHHDPSGDRRHHGHANRGRRADA